MSKTTELSRRTFLGKAAAITTATSAFNIVPRHVLGGAKYTSPNDKIRIAGHYCPVERMGDQLLISDG